MNKKAIVFSLISILISSLFLLIFSIFIHVPINQKASIEQENVKRAEDFLDIFPSYLETGIEMSTYNILSYMVNESPIDNFTNLFLNCIVNGTPPAPDNNEYCSLDISNNPSLDVVLENISNLASLIYRGTCTTELISIDVNQTGPYIITVNAVVGLHFLKGKTVEWDRIYSISKEVDLKGVKDPLTKNYLNRTINYLDETFTMEEIDEVLLRNFLEEDYNFVDQFAPSFIQVLEGDIDNTSDYGINLVMHSELDNGDKAYRMNTSMLALDYVLWKNTSEEELYLVNYSRLAIRNFTFSRHHLLRTKINFSDSNLILEALDPPCNCNQYGCSCES